MLQDASSAEGLPPGEFLFGARPGAAERSFVELQFDLTKLLQRVRA